MADFSWDDEQDPTKNNNVSGGASASSAIDSPYDAAFGASSPYGSATPPPAPAASAPPTPAPQANATAGGTAAPDDPWATAQHPTGAPATSAQAPEITGASGLQPSASPTQANGSDITAKYKDLMGQIGSAADPQQKAVLKDQLARSVFTSLKTAGHDVKWDGDQLMIDGRAYVVGEGSGIVAGESDPNRGEAPNLDEPIPSGQAPATSFGKAPSGYDQTKWEDPNSDSAKYILGRGINYAAMRQIPDEAGRKAFLAQEIQRLKPELEAKGWTVHEQKGDGIIISGHGYPPGFVDVVGDIEGAAVPAWNDGGGANPGAPSPVGDPDGLDPGTEGTAGVPTGGGPYVPGPAPAPSWDPTAPTYTPGTVDNSDLAGFDMASNQAALGPGTTVTPLDGNYEQGSVSNDPLDVYSYDGPRDLGTLGAGRTQQETEDLVSSILAHPESMDPRTVEMLKAKSKDELAEMQNQEDDDMTAASYRTGNADSNWLQSEKLASAGRRDQALVTNNRAVDMKAAETNLADRKSAAALGQSFADSKALNARADAAEKLAEQQANEGNKQAAAESRAKAAEFRRQGEQINEQMRADAFDRRTKVAQQNIENQFRSTAERQTAFKLAADTALAASAQKGDRMAFEEQIKQRATELGQSADKIRQDYVLGLLHESMTKYGIDVGADIDRAKLAAAGTEFQQDLAFRLKALAQAHDEFGASYGLDLTKTQHTIDQDNYDRYKETFGD